MSRSAANAPGCADLGRQASTLVCLWNQQRCSRVLGTARSYWVPVMSWPVPAAVDPWMAVPGRHDYMRTGGLFGPDSARSTLANPFNCGGHTAPRQPDDLSDL